MGQFGVSLGEEFKKQDYSKYFAPDPKCFDIQSVTTKYKCNTFSDLS